MKEKLNKINNIIKEHKILCTSILICVLVIVLCGSTYAYWKVTKKQTNQNVLIATCLDFEMISDDSTGISLEDSEPVTDEEGIANTEGYDFKVVNKCDIDIPIVVGMYTITKENKIPDTSVSVALDGEYVNKVSELNSFDKSLISADSGETIDKAYAIKYDVLPAGENETVEYNFKMWINSDSTVEDQSKEYTSRLFVLTETDSLDFSKITSEDAFTIDANGIITAYDFSYGKDVVLPTRVNGIKVMGISDNAFKKETVNDDILYAEATYTDGDIEKTVFANVSDDQDAFNRYFLHEFIEDYDDDYDKTAAALKVSDGYYKYYGDGKSYNYSSLPDDTDYSKYDEVLYADMTDMTYYFYGTRTVADQQVAKSNGQFTLYDSYDDLKNYDGIIMFASDDEDYENPLIYTWKSKTYIESTYASFSSAFGEAITYCTDETCASKPSNYVYYGYLQNGTMTETIFLKYTSTLDEDFNSKLGSTIEIAMLYNFSTYENVTFEKFQDMIDDGSLDDYTIKYYTKYEIYYKNDNYSQYTSCLTQVYGDNKPTDGSELNNDEFNTCFYQNYDFNVFTSSDSTLKKVYLIGNNKTSNLADKVRLYSNLASYTNIYFSNLEDIKYSPVEIKNYNTSIYNALDNNDNILYSSIRPFGYTTLGYVDLYKTNESDYYVNNSINRLAIDTIDMSFAYYLEEIGDYAFTSFDSFASDTDDFENYLSDEDGEIEIEKIAGVFGLKGLVFPKITREIKVGYTSFMGGKFDELTLYNNLVYKDDYFDWYDDHISGKTSSQLNYADAIAYIMGSTFSYSLISNLTISDVLNNSYFGNDYYVDELDEYLEFCKVTVSMSDEEKEAKLQEFANKVSYNTNKVLTLMNINKNILSLTQVTDTTFDDTISTIGYFALFMSSDIETIEASSNLKSIYEHSINGYEGYFVANREVSDFYANVSGTDNLDEDVTVVKDRSSIPSN